MQYLSFVEHTTMEVANNGEIGYLSFEKNGTKLSQINHLYEVAFKLCLQVCFVFAPANFSKKRPRNVDIALFKGHG